MYKEQLDEMINTVNEHFLKYGGPLNQKVKYALEQTPRHLFVENNVPYADRPLPIGHEQTISQPFIVAYMTQMLDVEMHHKVLEIGTGSGYQAAVLSHLAEKIYTVERVPELAMKTERILNKRIKTKLDDGCYGWEKYAPYDRIIVTATSQELTPPKALIDQLADDGKMIIPMKEAIGGNMFGSDERLYLIHKRKKGGGIWTEKLIGVRFVPLIKGEDNG
jgi:protein-L-isoaspartate(D-aspartate) O-methyltransferase